MLPAEAGELMSQAPHEIDEGDSEKERPRYLHEPETKRHSCTDKADEYVINRGRVQSNRAKDGCRSRIKSRHSVVILFLPFLTFG